VKPKRVRDGNVEPKNDLEMVPEACGWKRILEWTKEMGKAMCSQSTCYGEEEVRRKWGVHTYL
jgi:hypothetical protein